LEREHVLRALIEEVLGPRNGTFESLAEDFDPKNEYIVGVLAPKQAEEKRDVDAEAVLPDDGDTDEADDDADGDVFTSFSPSLDPKALPRSLGLSFVVLVAGNAKMDVCFTWARYISDGEFWHRNPDFEHFEFDIPTNRVIKSKKDSGIEYTIRTTPIDRQVYKVSVFMVNNTPLNEKGKAGTEQCIFQPEIRLNCIESNLLSVDVQDRRREEENDAVELEDLSLDLLYHARPALARGHLVGAVWKEIDPQRPHPAKTLPECAPFYWTDAGIVPADIAKRFRHCDVRTDYTPIYPVQAPSMGWRQDEYGPLPELDPVVLSGSWEPSELRDKLRPFVSGYSKWLKTQISNAQPLRDKFGAAIDEHISEIQRSIGRIEKSIELICSNEEVRLAFCFANKSMALQSFWANKRVNPWRPFQLAFILQNLSSIAESDDPERATADLLWFATGGGKTEAYLGLAIFAIAFKRRMARTDASGHKTGAGVNVLSRYTLRLLTIQQFRRALRVITAAELLRVQGLGPSDSPVGWRPMGCPSRDDFIWGTERISVGLWVGGKVTPNSMHSLKFPDEKGEWHNIPGAVELLGKQGKKTDGEPAQVVTCPCCSTLLAVPNDGLGRGVHTLHLLVKVTGALPALDVDDFKLDGASVTDIRIQTHANPVYHTVSLMFEVVDGHRIKSESIDTLWRDQLHPKLGLGSILIPARPTRPGYFVRKYATSQRTERPWGFDIACPNSECDLNQVQWAEKVPASVGNSQLSSSADMEFQEVFEPFRVPGAPSVSSRVPIPAYTIDDQVYHRCPSMVIATADKFAQLPFESRAATIFGNVEYYHSRWGYYRENCLPSDGGSLSDSIHPHPPGFHSRSPLHKRVSHFDPPTLIIQDELHLIEGPLGSLYGLYETVVDELCSVYDGERKIGPKYVASTATVRQAQDQITSLYTRNFVQFPPSGLSADDNFFSTNPEIHPLDSEAAGRLYLGICAPGRGAQTPLVRIWSSLLQAAQGLHDQGIRDENVDGFWTVVGYFNAIRELAGAMSLYRQDIPERINFITNDQGRQLSEDALELSGRKDSMELPGLLEQLSIGLMDGTPEDGVFTTSMFGTGVDVDRLRLMVINGQPKSTSSYIQASGRVGRRAGGLVVSFFRASRPRDLDHYEFFTGYHRALYRYVEPVTVSPFSPRAREKALGPLSVAMLRQARFIRTVRVPASWRYQQKLSGQGYASAAGYIRNQRHAAEVLEWIRVLQERVQQLPDARRPEVTKVIAEIRSELDRWQSLALRHSTLLYSESAMARTPQNPVVLGDQQHYFRQLDVAFENVPKSLRDVEGTITFKI